MKQQDKKDVLLYISLCLIALFLTSAIGILFTTDYTLPLVEGLTQATKIFLANVFPNLFSGVVGVVISLAVAKFLFDVPYGKPLVEHGVLDIWSHNNANRIFDHLIYNINKVKRGQIVIADNWVAKTALEQQQFNTAISNALGRQVEIIFIIMHPNSPVMQRRQLNIPTGEIPALVTESLTNLQTLYCDIKKEKGNSISIPLEIYCCDAIITMQVFYLPHISYLGFYSSLGQSSLGPQIILSNNGPLSDMLEKHTEHLVKHCRSSSGIQYNVKIDLEANSQLDNPIDGIRKTICGVTESQIHDLFIYSGISGVGNVKHPANDLIAQIRQVAANTAILKKSLEKIIKKML